ncbi:MAG: LAGLIDADG family homing endonuclease, partial [Acidimicrobiia bacterium]
VGRMDQGEHEVIGLHLGDGTALWLTADHRVLTERGWVEAGELGTADRVARPRAALGFGDDRPVPPEHARLLGYLIGDGSAGGEAPVMLTSAAQPLGDDAAAIARSLGCDARRRGAETSFSPRRGEQDGVLALARWAEVGHPEPTGRIPAPFFAPGVSAEVVANLLSGLFEAGGWVGRRRSGGLRAGFSVTSEELAHQVHWLLLRWGVGSSVRAHDPKGRRRPRVAEGPPRWEVRVSGDDVEGLAAALPTWGPRGQELAAELARPRPRRDSPRGRLPAAQTEPVLAYLRGRGVTPRSASELAGEGAERAGGSLRAVLGGPRIRRDRLERLAAALDSEFLRGVLAEDLWYDRIVAVSPAEWRPIYDIEVDEHHTFVANDVVVSNCSPPFKQCEFDIGFGQGISREGSLIDVGTSVGLVKKSGAWYTYEGEQLGQGRENAKQFLKDHPEVMVELDDRIRRQVGLVPGGEEGRPGDDEPILIGE